MKVREAEASATKKLAPRGTKRPGDQESDQVRDQATNNENLVALASELLEAVATGRTESLGLALQLAEGLLDVPLFRRAATLRDLLRDRSPFALVRAVELAEAVVASANATGTRSRAGG